MDLAIADQTQVIKLDPKNKKAYLDRGIAHNKKRENDLAVADLSQAIKLDPSYVNAYVMRGAIYFDTLKYDLAKSDMNTVLRLAPGNKFATDLLQRIAAIPK